MTDTPRKVSDAQRKQRIAAGKARGRKNESVRSAKKSGKQTFDAKAVADEIARYEAMDLPIDTWNDVKAKLQAKHQAQENQHKLNLYRIETGDLILREQSKQDIEDRMKIVSDQINKLGNIMAELAPQSERAEYRKLGRRAAAVLNNAIAEVIPD